jgi:multidrug efflux system membrane fusion protein
MKRPSCIPFIFFALILCTSCTPEKSAAKAKPPVPVKATQAIQKDMPIQLKAIGTVEAFTSVAIKSQVDGQIARIHFTEGSDVEKGALLVSINPEPFQAALSQSEATLAKDLAQVKFAREQALRYEGLLKEGIVTKDQYDLLQANAESLAAVVASDRAAIRNAKIQLAYCSIRSPISGRTGSITQQPGNLIKANDLPIVTINQIRPVNVTFAIPEKRLAELKRSLAGKEVRLETAPQNGTIARETGTVSFLDNAVNPATGTIKLKGVFANASRALWPGQFTDLLITLGTRKNAVIVPTAAVQNSQQGEFVYVIKQDNKVEMRQITSAMVAGENTVIEKGVAAGETVVVDGQLRLSPGATVETKEKQPSSGTKK